jgi:hypothetical protein
MIHDERNIYASVKKKEVRAVRGIRYTVRGGARALKAED